MIRLKINNREIEAEEGATLLQVAAAAGHSIPTLCHDEGLPHYSSCMVCMVRETRTNQFLPSCSAIAQDGMDIDVDGEQVIAIRSKALDLLLSEHRAECEAPCRVVCPAGYNIPLMNRLLIAGDFDAALKLAESEITDAEVYCRVCPGYCENACRRKKIDIPVSIRNIWLFAASRFNESEPVVQESVSVKGKAASAEQQSRPRKTITRFTSRIGKIEESEQGEWLKECSVDAARFREITSRDSATCEAGNCMHCDCRAADNCTLRELADVYGVKDPRGKLTYAPIVKKINRNTGLIYESAKCVKCGLCVRLCESLGEEPALCFINRGFVSIISEPLTEDFDNVIKTQSEKVIEICPTGALGKFRQSPES